MFRILSSLPPYLATLLSSLLYQEEMKLRAVSGNVSYELRWTLDWRMTDLEGIKRLSNGRSNMAGVGTNSLE